MNGTPLWMILNAALPALTLGSDGRAAPRRNQFNSPKPKNHKSWTTRSPVKIGKKRRKGAKR